MRGPRVLIAGVVALLLVAGLVACGGDDSSSSSTTSTEPAQAQAGGGKEAKSDGEAKAGSGGGEEKRAPEGSSGDFTPKQHSDSGGGSQQYLVQGGDNSVQEFGEEADTSERDAAATALHNFFDARAEGDFAAACDYLSKTIIKSFEQLSLQSKQAGGQGCGAALENLTNLDAQKLMEEEAAQANVGSLRTDGENAFILYTGAEGTVIAMPMENEGGVWKVASLAGTPLS